MSRKMHNFFKRMITVCWDIRSRKDHGDHLVKILCFNDKESETQERYVSSQGLKNELMAGIRLKSLSLFF